MTDLGKTIDPKSDQLNADDLIVGPKNITITKVVGNESNDQPISIFFDGDKGKPYKPGLSMRRVLVQVWGVDGDRYVGRTMTLYRDPEVSFGGIKVGGIRISHMSHIDKPVALMLTATRGRKNQYTVRPLPTDPVEQILERAREEARGGVENFTVFWNSDFGKQHRDTLKGHIAEFQSIAKATDEGNGPSALAKLADKARGKTEQPAPAPESAQEADIVDGTAQDAPEPEASPYETLDASDAAPGSQAWDRGLADHAEGKPISECPYDLDKPEAVDYCGAWRNAEKATS